MQYRALKQCDFPRTHVKECDQLLRPRGIFEEMQVNAAVVRWGVSGGE